MEPREVTLVREIEKLRCELSDLRAKQDAGTAQQDSGDDTGCVQPILLDPVEELVSLAKANGLISARFKLDSYWVEIGHINR